MSTTGGVEVEQMEETVTYESNTSLEELMLHNTCPIHMLLKCLPQFDQIVQLYFRCKVCQQPQVHAGINTFLQHVKEEHGEFFQPQFEVVSDSDNVTMVVMPPPPVKAEVVETIATESQDGYHDNDNLTDTYEASVLSETCQEISGEGSDTNNIKSANIKSEGSVTVDESEVISQETQEIASDSKDEVTISQVSTTSASETTLARPSEKQIVTSSAEIVQGEEIDGTTVIEMSTEEAEQVLIQAGTQVIKHDLIEGGETELVIHGNEVEIGGVEALIRNQSIETAGLIGHQSIEARVASSGEVREVSELVGLHQTSGGHPQMETQVVGSEAIEVHVVAPGSHGDYHQIVTTPSSQQHQSSSSSLEMMQGLKQEIYHEEIQVSDLQLLQDQAHNGGQPELEGEEAGDDVTGLKYRKCKRCLKTFVNNHSLQRHYKETHLASPNWFVCPVPGCKYMAKRRSDIVGSHLRRRHKNVDIAKWQQDPSKVKKVHLPLSAEKLAENQMLIDQCMLKKKKPRVPRMAPDGNIYTCKECDLYFSNMKMLKRHHQTKHADEILWMLCPVDGCNFTCKTKRHLLDIHIPRRHREQNIDYYKENKNEVIQKVYLPRGMKYLPEYEEQLYTDNTEYLEEAETLLKKKELVDLFPLSEVCEQTSHGYSCKICQKTYKEKKRIRHHYRIFHSDPTLRPRSRRGHLPVESMAIVAPDKTLEEMESLVCRECNREYKSKHSLRRHYIDNHLDEIIWYLCPVQSCMYASKRHADLLQSHCERIHKGVDVGEYKKKPGLLKTLSVPPGEHPINTDQSVVKSRSKSYAIEEIADVYAVGDVASFKCKECGKDFSSRHAMRQHFGDNHAELITWYKCPVDGCFFRCKRRHELVFLHFPKSHPDFDSSHWREDPTKLEYVKQPPEVDTARSDNFLHDYPAAPGRNSGTFPIESVMDMSVSSEETGYKCRFCEEVCGLKRDLRHHYRGQHAGTEVWFRCPVENCGYMSSRQHEMVSSHLSLTHAGQEVLPWIQDPSLLEQVQVQLDSDDEQEEEVKEEEGSKEPQSVPAKRKRGSFPLEVIAKQPVEGELLQFTCVVCEKSYSSVIALRRHYEANHAETITWYKCPVQECRYATKRPLDLFTSHCPRIHKSVDVSRWKKNRRLLDVMLLPPGEEPFSTDKGDNFIQPVAMVDNEIEVNRCKYCSREYDTRENLRRHYNNDHQDEGVTWYKCPILSCDLIRRRPSEILGAHFTKNHSGVDGSLWKDNPHLLESIKLPQGISQMGEQLLNGNQKKSSPKVKQSIKQEVSTPQIKQEVITQDTPPINQDSSFSSSDESYPCPKCGLEFQSLATFRRHENSSHPPPLATSITWYKCPVGDCKFITNTVSGILKTHCGRVHSNVDISTWREEPSLIDTVEMAAGIGSVLKKTSKEPKSQGKAPVTKRRKIAVEEDEEDEIMEDQIMEDQIMEDQMESFKSSSTESPLLRRSERPLNKTATRLTSVMKGKQRDGTHAANTPSSDTNTDGGTPKRGRGRPPKKTAESEPKKKALPFRCNECDHNYGDVQSLQNHYDLVHAKTQWYRCPVSGCKVVARLWGEISEVHWVLEHTEEEVSKYLNRKRPPQTVTKVPQDSIVFSADEGMEVINVKSEPGQTAHHQDSQGSD